VVAHGDILRCVVDGVSRYLSDHPERAEDFRVRFGVSFLPGSDGGFADTSKHWKNGELKVFTFKSDDDQSTEMVEVEEGELEPKDATSAPTSEGAV